MTRLIFFLCAIPVCLFAEAEPLTLDQALSQAMEKNEQLLSLKEQKEAGRQRRLQAYSSWMPTATLSGQATRMQEAAFQGGHEQKTVSLNLSQAVLSSDLYYGVKSSRHALDSLEYELAEFSNELIFAIRQAYYKIILAQEDVKVQQENINVLSDALRREEHEFELGDSTIFDVNQSKVSVSNALSGLYEAEKTLKVARNALVRLLGRESQYDKDLELSEEEIPILSIQDLSGKLSQLGMVEREGENEAVITEELFSKKYAPQKLGVSIYSEEEIQHWEGIALARRPKIKKMVAVNMSAEEYLNQKKGEYLPVVSASASYDKVYPSSTSVPQLYENWALGVQVSWDLFDGLGRERRINEARALNSSAHFDMVNVIEDAKVEVRDAIYEIEEALLSYYAAHEGVLLADEAIDQAKARRDLGVITPLEYRDVVASRTKAKQIFIQASYRLLTSYYSLRYATGVDVS